MDNIYYDLKKQAQSRIGLVHKVEVAMNDSEFLMLQKKAEELKMSPDDLLRQYILNTSAFLDPNETVKRSTPKRTSRSSSSSRKSSNNS